MSYKISVPIINGSVARMGREALAETLKELDAERVMLALDCYEKDPEKRKEIMETLKENTKYFHGEGFEVGAWIWTFMFNGDSGYTPISMVSEEQTDFNNFACPLDEDFKRFSGEYIADVARCGVDMIMFDDDYRYGFHSGGNMGCICELHRKRICDDIGENITRAELARQILSGGKSKYRDAWIKENGYSLESFAKNVREYVDKVDPKIRVGLCACLSSWDIDGTDIYTLSKLLAGDTRPFARLSGAPYWASGEPTAWGNHLQDVVELERMERAWIGDVDIELMAEGDGYPRPRTKCPASYLEGFDTAVRASGNIGGILKYAIDYTSSPKYERGYVEFHKRNRELYDIIDSSFSGKEPCGIRVYEKPNKAGAMDVTDKKDPRRSIQFSFFSAAARLLGAQAIPTTYEGRGVCGIAFGENVKYLDDEARRGGLIIDGSGAKILHTMGIDVGIEELGSSVNTVAEYFRAYDDIAATYKTKVNDHRFSSSINILSEGWQTGVGVSLLGENSGNGVFPMSYTYENADGERYLVLNTDLGDCAEFCDIGFIRNYFRGRQIADSVEWLSRGKRLPAYTYGNPNIYMMAKEKDGTLSVGIWNFYADIVIEPTVELGEAYSELKILYGGDGRLEADKVKLSDIPAYGFAAFEVKK